MKGGGRYGQLTKKWQQQLNVASGAKSRSMLDQGGGVYRPSPFGDYNASYAIDIIG